MQHYTDLNGYNGISSHPTWRLVAAAPPGEHPFGAYFTNLGPETRHLAKRLRIPKSKLAYRFEFVGEEGLEPMDGGRGAFILFSACDYLVEPPRQRFKGPTGL